MKLYVINFVLAYSWKEIRKLWISPPPPQICNFNFYLLTSYLFYLFKLLVLLKIHRKTCYLRQAEERLSLFVATLIQLCVFVFVQIMGGSAPPPRWNDGMINGSGLKCKGEGRGAQGFSPEWKRSGYFLARLIDLNEQTMKRRNKIINLAYPKGHPVTIMPGAAKRKAISRH